MTFRTALASTLLAAALAAAPATRQAGPAATSLTFQGGDGPGRGRHVVFISGDEEYRSEEALPMLAKILSRRHGFTTTVLFALDPDGTINPKATSSLSNPEALDSADAIVMSIRFRKWPDETMARFKRRFDAGVPIVALRTSTHAFSGFPADSPYASWNWDNAGGFGRRVFGETWVNHWGKHKVEATRGVIEPGAEREPVLRGVTDVFGDSDVYEAYPPADATILLRGLVLESLAPDARPADYSKTRSTDKQAQGINAPPMPIAWTRVYASPGGSTNRVLVTTMGAATDLKNEGLRRLIVNGVYWGLGMDVPERADVAFVDPFSPTAYGFDGFRKGLHVSDFDMGREH